MGVSAVLILIPRMVTVMMEGLTALGNAASAYMKSKMGDDAEIYIGMDIALGLGDPCCITSNSYCNPMCYLNGIYHSKHDIFPNRIINNCMLCNTNVCYGK